jgi:hypothetical protein
MQRYSSTHRSRSERRCRPQAAISAALDTNLAGASGAGGSAGRPGTAKKDDLHTKRDVREDLWSQQQVHWMPVLYRSGL